MTKITNESQMVKSWLSIPCIFVALIGNPFLGIPWNHAWGQEKEVVFFEDDFEDGDADGWSFSDATGQPLSSPWPVENDGGNLVLSGSDHQWATIGDRPWADFSFRTRVKLLSGAVHLNYRIGQNGRYFIGFSDWGLSLSKTTELTSVSDPHNYGQWYTVEIVGNGGNIQIFVDSILKIDYTDNDPIISGSIAFETLDDSHVHFDDILVKGYVSTKVTWLKTTGLPGGGVTGLAFAPSNPDIVYVATNVNNMGIFRSSDGGNSWRRTFRAGHTTGLAVDPTNADIAYIVDVHGQIHKTVNGGVTWERKIEVSTTLNAIAVSLSNPAILYIGASNGTVFKSTDEGENWTQTSSGLPAISSLVVHSTNSDVVYAGTQNGVYKSTNGGSSWSLSGLSGISVTSLTIDPSNSNVLFAATSNGVYKTTNGGNSWQSKNNGLSFRDVHYIVFNPTNSAIVYAATIQGIYKSTDAGENWSDKNSGLDFKDVSLLGIHPSRPNEILVGTAHWLWTFHYHFPNNIYYHEGIYRSVNGGESWSRSDEGFIDDDVRTLTVDPNNPDVLYVGTECSRGVYKTTDGGITWGLTPEGDPNGAGDLAHYSMSIAVGQASPHPIYLTGRFGIGKSLDGGNSWQNLFHRRHFHGIAIHPTNPQVVYMGTAAETDPTQQQVYPGAHIFKTSNGGQSWQEVDTGFPHGATTAIHSVVIDPSDPSTVYVGTAAHGHPAATSALGIFKTIDGGQNWIETNNGLTSLEVPVLTIDPTNTNIVYAGTGDGVFKTMEGGANWIQIGLSGQSVHALAIDPSGPQRLYAGHENGVSMSVDGGNNWTTVNYGLDGEVLSLALASSGKILYAASPRNGVFRGILTDFYQTSDYCDFWSNNSFFRDQLIEPGTVITATDPDGVVCGSFVVENEGVYNLRVYGDDPNTVSIDEGASEGDVITFFINGYPATGNSVWTLGGSIQLDLSALVTSVEEAELPESYQLLQNYPNPFNNSTVIRYRIPTPSFVRLQVFNILGQEVMVLVNTNQLPGIYKVELDASDLSSGIYLYRVQAGEFVKTKKLLFLK